MILNKKVPEYIFHSKKHISELIHLVQIHKLKILEVPQIRDQFDLEQHLPVQVRLAYSLLSTVEINHRGSKINIMNNKSHVKGTREALNDNTSTTQSRSFATPKATPQSLSIAPAETNMTNHGRRSKVDTEVGGTE